MTHDGSLRIFRMGSGLQKDQPHDQSTATLGRHKLGQGEGHWSLNSSHGQWLHQLGLYSQTSIKLYRQWTRWSFRVSEHINVVEWWHVDSTNRWHGDFIPSPCLCVSSIYMLLICTLYNKIGIINSGKILGEFC